MPSKAALERLASEVRTGGKGSVRRKKKVVHKTTSPADAQLTSALRALPGFRPLDRIEEANLFVTDGTVLHFTNPRVLASVEANTMAISGRCQNKKLTDLFPSILPQMGMENLAKVAQMLESHEHDHEHEHHDGECSCHDCEEKKTEEEKKPESA